MNNKGQVGVIIAILLITILVSVLITVQVYYIPQWMKERESEHMDSVGNQFAGLKYSLDLIGAEQSNSPLTNSITLGSKELPYFVSSRSFGSLQVQTPSVSNFSIDLNGTGRESTYQTIDSDSGNITNIIKIKSFDLVISSLIDGAIYNATFKDTTTSIEIWRRDDIASTYQINLTVINNSKRVFNQPIIVGLDATVINYGINLLNDDYKISTNILPYISTPFNMSFDMSLNAKYSITCKKYNNIQNIQYSSYFGTIKYKAENAYFVDQDYIYEGGSVILSQASGDSLSYPLLLSVSNSSKVINITFTNIQNLPGKTGVSGYGTFPIRSNFSTSSKIGYAAENMTLKINTIYSTAWYNYLDNEFNQSGISYKMIAGDDYVSIQLNNIELIINKVEIIVQIGPGWIT